MKRTLSVVSVYLGLSDRLRFAVAMTSAVLLACVLAEWYRPTQATCAIRKHAQHGNSEAVVR